MWRGVGYPAAAVVHANASPGKPVSIHRPKGGGMTLLRPAIAPGKAGLTSRSKGTGFTTRHAVGP